jgi:hypothetical protein
MDIMKKMELVTSAEWNAQPVTTLKPALFVLVIELIQNWAVLVQFNITTLVKMNVHHVVMLVWNVI